MNTIPFELREENIFLTVDMAVKVVHRHIVACAADLARRGNPSDELKTHTAMALSLRAWLHERYGTPAVKEAVGRYTKLLK